MKNSRTKSSGGCEGSSFAAVSAAPVAAESSVPLFASGVDADAFDVCR